MDCLHAPSTRPAARKKMMNKTPTAALRLSSNLAPFSILPFELFRALDPSDIVWTLVLGHWTFPRNPLIYPFLAPFNPVEPLPPAPISRITLRPVLVLHSLCTQCSRCHPSNPPPLGTLDPSDIVWALVLGHWKFLQHPPERKISNFRNSPACLFLLRCPESLTLPNNTHHACL